MVEDFPATLKAIFDPNYGNIRPVSQPIKRGSLAIKKPEKLYSFSYRVLTRQSSVFRTEMDKRKAEMRH
jgi:hypothetical protein